MTIQNPNKFKRQKIVSTSFAFLMLSSSFSAFADNPDLNEETQYPIAPSMLRIEREVEIPLAYYRNNLINSSISSLEKELNEVKERHPFILHTQDGNLSVNPFFVEEQKTLLDMNDLIYSLVKGHVEYSNPLMENLFNNGWSIGAYTGLEGGNPRLRSILGSKSILGKGIGTLFPKHWKEHEQFGDVPSGIVCYHPKKSLMTVVYHGTATVDHIKAGWETNYDAEPIDARNFSLNIPGSVHAGFAKKYASTKPEVLVLIKEFMSKMTTEEKANLKIIFTGHSQAGAVGNLALYDIAANHGQELFGSTFNNNKDARFYGYFLSAARIGDATYVNAMHQTVGKDFIIRQNVQGDPVPIASGNRTLGSTIGLIIPYFKKISIYRDTGHLLLDKGSGAWNRTKQNTEVIQDYWHTQQQTVKDLVLDEYSALKYALNPKIFIQEMKKDIGKNIKKPWRALKLPYNILKYTHKRIAKVVKPPLSTTRNLVKNTLVARFAHYHYGHNSADGRGAVFSPEVVSTDAEKMLQQGLKR